MSAFLSRSFVLVVIVILISVSTVAVQEPQAWLHVQIEDEGVSGDAQNFNLDLPLGAVSGVLGMIPNTLVENGQLRFSEEQRLEVAAIREVWQKLQSTGEDEFVSQLREKVSIRVVRIGERIDIFIEEDGEVIQVDVPMAVVDALLSDDVNMFNIDAALDVLRGLRGESIYLTEPDRRIRVWIGEMPNR
jgi:hypothetical protein